MSRSCRTDERECYFGVLRQSRAASTGPRAIEPRGSGAEQGGEHRFGVGEIWKEEVRAEVAE